jgi:hypothetical protein
MDASQIREHLMVHAKGEGSMHGAPGVHIGTVDRVEDGKYIKLTKNDSPDGEHRWLPIEWVESVDDKAVYLRKTAAEVQAALTENHPEEESIQRAEAERDPISGAGIG